MVSQAMRVVAVLLLCVAPLCGEESALKQGTVDLQSAGPLAFGPDGVLIVGDTSAASIYAIQTGDISGNPEKVTYEIAGIDNKVAAKLGTSSDQIQINDLAVNPLSGIAYLSVSRGRGPSAAAVILRVTPDKDISELSLKNVKYSKAELPNAHPKGAVDRRRRSLRQQSITDIAYFEGRVLVAGLSNEEFASTLRSIPYPFENIDGGTSVEIFHGAHGRFETRSPVRTFATFQIDSKPYLLASYTCTPLVKFSLNDLEPGKKVRGTTIAELGNRNNPLDMVVYTKGGSEYILMANDRRGMMKISTKGIQSNEGITKKTGIAGQPYETIEELSKVGQLDRLNSKLALVISKDEDGVSSLRSVALP